MLINGTWIEEPLPIKQEIFTFFRGHFKEPILKRPSFINQRFKKLTVEDRKALEAEFTELEIKNVVWLCGGSKAPGPDGFNFNFIKKNWEVMKTEVCNAVRKFEATGKFGKGCNPYFIALLPNVKDPLLISDFRPICLLGSFYKIVAKLLTERLKGVVGQLVSETQTTFVHGRQITDAILLANKKVFWGKREKTQLLLLKADFAKAFDSLNWSFLQSVLQHMNFRDKWRNWIAGCLSSARVSILVNGSPTEEFDMERGLCQGDPLSPFLFILAMKSLHVMMDEVVSCGIFQPACTKSLSSSVCRRRHFQRGMVN